MTVDVYALKVIQPIGEFYIGAIDANKLNEIATVEVREFKDDEAKDLAGIQRPLSKERLKKLQEYVNFDYATFPTSVVLAIDERNVTITQVPGCDGLHQIRVHGFPGSDDEAPIPLEEAALIIDGQHRLAGLGNLREGRVFEVNVSIFIGADLADKAEIFSTVNLSQTKVNRSLVYDLFSYAESTSPFKMAHEIAIAMDHDPFGPFYRRIKRLGVATPGRGEVETLSQATVVRGLLRYFPKNPEEERNKGLKGFWSKTEPGENWRQTIFSPFYRAGDDAAILNITTNYFAAVAEKWPTAWWDTEEGFVLNRTNGYNALIRFMQEAYIKLVSEPRIVEKSEFAGIFGHIDLDSGAFVTAHFPPGSTGASKLFKSLMAGHMV